MQNQVFWFVIESCNIDTFSYFGLLLNLDFSHWVKWESEKKKKKDEVRDDILYEPLIFNRESLDTQILFKKKGKKKKTFTLCVRSLVVGKKKYDKFRIPSLRFGLIPIKSTTFKK